MGILFQKLPGPIYPAYLVVGEYSIALEPELITSLKEIASEENDLFLKDLVSRVGRNRYLREMMEAEIAKSENKAELVFKLRNTLKDL